jgi:repressor LexA
MGKDQGGRHRGCFESADERCANVAAAFGFAPRNAAQKHVLALAEIGAIDPVPNQKRGLRLSEAGAPDLLALPLLDVSPPVRPIGPGLGLDQELRLDALDSS